MYFIHMFLSMYLYLCMTSVSITFICIFLYANIVSIYYIMHCIHAFYLGIVPMYHIYVFLSMDLYQVFASMYARLHFIYFA